MSRFDTEYEFDLTDKGMSEPEPAAEMHKCQSCGAKSSEPLVWVGYGWDFNGCAECLAACAQQMAAELAAEIGEVA